jgi:DNA-binding transcriptional LysR family regulator
MHTLRIFCSVARHGSFSLAAAEHGITQSAASQRVGQLEKKLGVPLLDRSVRPLGLTAAGKQFLDGSADLIERYGRLQRSVSHFRRLDGHVRVDAIYSAGIDLLRHLRERFVAAHEGVSVTINYKRPDAVYDEVRQGRCDIGILSYPQRWRDVSVIPLRDERMAVVCPPNHPLAPNSQVHVGQLSDLPMVAFEPEMPVGRRIRKYFRDHDVAPQVVNVFDNIDTIKSAVAVTSEDDGDGVAAILPRRTVLREVSARTLAVVELEPKLVRPMGIIHARRGGNGHVFSPAVRAFVDFLLEHAGPNVDTVDDTSARRAQLVGDRS